MTTAPAIEGIRSSLLNLQKENRKIKAAKLYVAKVINQLDKNNRLIQEQLLAAEKELKTVKKELKELKENSLGWSLADFVDYELEGYSMTTYCAEKALKQMIREHDASVGITWDTVEHYYVKWATELS